jgi:hypothetical protein
MGEAKIIHHRHREFVAVIASEAKQSSLPLDWIASSLRSYRNDEELSVVNS